MKRSFTLALLCTLLLPFAPLAQIPAPSRPPANDKDDVVVINTNLIQIDATVTDKDGRPVTDLGQEDFEIYENGKPQAITNFSFVSILSGSGAAPGAGRKEKEKDRDAAPPSPPVAAPAGVRREQVRRTLALVVDDLGMSFGSTKWTKDALKKFVDQQLQPGDLVAIIRTSSGAGALQQFTTDRRLLHAAIDRIRWNVRSSVSTFSPIEPNLSEILSNTIDLAGPVTDDGETKSVHNVEGMKEEREMERDLRESREDIFAAGTLGAVNFVMRGMGQLPGRKAVILFSDGFKLFSRKGLNARVQNGLQRLTDTANRSGVIIYTMDARGLDAPMLSAQDNTFGLTTEQVDTLMEERRADFSDTQQSLRTIARQTGGFAIINQNDLTKGIQRVLDDQKSYYLIGYRPDEDVFDIEKRRFNSLSVKVRRPGLRVRYRSGFFGMTDDEARPQPRNAAQQLIAALTSPFVSKDIDVRLTSLFAGDAAANAYMRTLVFIRAGDLKFKELPDGWHKTDFDVSVLTFNDGGEVVDQVNRTQSVRVRADHLKNLYDHGMVCSVTLPIRKPGAYQMRVAVRDAATARIGSASQYVEVPNLKKKHLTLSGVVLERVAGKGPQAAEDARAREMRMERDAAVRRFRSGDAVRFGLSVYNAKLDKASGRPSLLVQYRIYRDGKEIFASREKPVEVSEQPRYQVIDTADGFSLGGNMRPGDYVMQVVVRDMFAKGNRQAATQWTDFEITP